MNGKLFFTVLEAGKSKMEGMHLVRDFWLPHPVDKSGRV
jgi:hypothetical protein